MAGTSQMLDIQQRDFSPQFYKPLVFHADSSLVWWKRVTDWYATEQRRSNARLTRWHTVISAGHDTQFALFGAGAEQKNPCSPPVHGKF